MHYVLKINNHTEYNKKMRVLDAKIPIRLNITWTICVLKTVFVELDSETTPYSSVSENTTYQ